MLKNHPDKIKVRPLVWKNTKQEDTGIKYNYVSAHGWLSK
jgi:hypothetical protein